MHRRFIALVLSTSLIITSLGTGPARADDTDKWIAGVVGLTILGLALHEEKKNKRKRRAIQNSYNTQNHQHQGYTHSHNHGVGQHNHSNTHGHAGPIIVKPKGHVKPRRNKRLPASCQVTKRFHGQKIRGFAKGCLKRNNVNVRALPQQCKYKIINRNNGNKRVIFGSRCLKDRGYRVARAH